MSAAKFLPLPYFKFKSFKIKKKLIVVLASSAFTSVMPELGAQEAVQTQPLVVDSERVESKRAARESQSSDRGRIDKASFARAPKSNRYPNVYSIHQERILGLDSLKLLGPTSQENPDALPIYASGEHLEGYVDSVVTFTGQAQVIRGNMVVQADELSYDRKTEVATAPNTVLINQNGNIIEGTRATVHLPSSTGQLEDVRYYIYGTPAHGSSDVLELISKEDYTLTKATYTLCQINNNGKYDWVLQADRIDLDIEDDTGIARNAVLRFKGVPILATPWMSFPLSDKRRSGLLTPSFDIGDDNGFSYYQPYYWNIAPNYDATITPFIMSKRGVGLQGEFRYLQSTYSGTFSALYLPHDRLRSGNKSSDYAEVDNSSISGASQSGVINSYIEQKSKRWGYEFEHHQLLSSNLGFLGQAQLNLEMNRVSDDYFWEDFPKNIGATNSRLLNSEGTIATSNKGLYSLVRVQRWQTLQAQDSYIVPPYDRTQLRMGYNKRNFWGFDLSVMGDVTKFASGDITRSQTDATRSILQLEGSYPYRTAGFFIVPKAKLTTRYYDFNNPMQYANTSNSFNANTGVKSLSLSIPTFSVDTGLIYERSVNLFSNEYTQTLEPRAMYVYTPYKNQSLIPLYDTAQYDDNLATVFLDNPYAGYDRIADVNMLILGVGTQWIKPETGQQVLSLNVAQRLRFEDQKVTLDNVPITSRYSDVLFNVSTSLIKDWRFDALVQYDTKENRSQRSLLMARWKPGEYRAMNLAYRMQRGISEQLDYSWQWPIGRPWFGSRLPQRSESGGRWYSVGRINYSLRDQRLVDGVLGVEYQSCCWIARVAFERNSTGYTTSKTRILFQLELSGLSRVGVNPLQRMRDSITNYETIQNERFVKPYDFYFYE